MALGGRLEGVTDNHRTRLRECPRVSRDFGVVPPQCPLGAPSEMRRNDRQPPRTLAKGAGRCLTRPGRRASLASHPDDPSAAPCGARTLWCFRRLPGTYTYICVTV